MIGQVINDLLADRENPKTRKKTWEDLASMAVYMRDNMNRILLESVA